MGLFNHNSQVAADELMQEVIVRPADEVLTVGGGQYVPPLEGDTDFQVQRAFYLDRGVHGTTHHVRGEHPGVVYERAPAAEGAQGSLTLVAVPVKAHNFTTTYHDVKLSDEQVAEVTQGATAEKFYKKLIAHAVLVAANGTQIEQ